MWSYVVSFLVINKYGLLYLCNLLSLFLTFIAGLFAVSWFFGAEVKRKILYRFKVKTARLFFQFKISNFSPKS